MEPENLLIILLSAVGGAFVGGVFTLIGGYLQSLSHESWENKKILFEARKQTYTEALSYFTKVKYERGGGKAYPDSKEESDLFHKIVGPLSLFASKELMVEIYDLFDYYAKTLPTDEYERDSILEKENIAWGKVTNQMRKDLGTKSLAGSGIEGNVLSA